MCYFGPPPCKVVDVETGEATEYPNLGDWSLDKAEAGELEPGFYYVIGTGSYYTFYDGKQRWEDRNDWGKPSDKYWQETGGINPKFAKYSFEYQNDSEDPCIKEVVDRFIGPTGYSFNYTAILKEKNEK